jgi:uncharacterized protein YjaZ
MTFKKTITNILERLDQVTLVIRCGLSCFAYLYADEIVAARGHATVGLSPFSGFYVGMHLINAYREAAGVDLMQAFTTPTSDILKASGTFKTLSNPRFMTLATTIE